MRRWLCIGAVLTGCVFTSRPMIPDNTNTDNDPTRTSDGGGVARADAPAASDRGVPPTDHGPLFEDLPPSPEDTGTATPVIDASVPADIAAASDVGSAFDTTGFTDDASVDASSLDAAGDVGAGAACDAGDAGDGACTVDADVADAEIPDAE